MTPNLLCDNCIHNKICKLKDIIEPDMHFCPDQLLPETIGFISRANNLCLSKISQKTPTSKRSVGGG